MRLRAGSKAVLAVLAVVALAAPSAAATLRNVEWQAGPEKGTESLVLRFASEVPDVEVDTEPWGLSVWLPGMTLDRVATEGIGIVAENGGSRLRVERPGIELRSFKIEGSSVSLLMGRVGTLAQAASTYRIGIGDVVTVSVYKNSDLSGDFTVSPDGTISLPLVGPVPAVGLTDAALASRLQKLLEKDFLVNPQVAVTVKTYQSQWVYIAGSVARATRIALVPGMTIKDVLSEAGIALGPGQQIVLSRTGAGESGAVLDAAALEAGAAPAPRDGDVLTVQEPSYVYLQGEVRRPGRLPLTPAMTVLQAISMSEGFTEWANKKEVRVLRTVNGETLEEIVNLKKVEERKEPDLPLRPGDVVVVRRKIL